MLKNLYCITQRKEIIFLNGYSIKLLKENGISLFYDFILVSINNEYLGIYALEESFDKNMLSNNNLSDSPIIKIGYVFSEEYKTNK